MHDLFRAHWEGVGWIWVPMGLAVQDDSYSCGIWCCVMRDIMLEYVASGQCGSRQFVEYAKADLTSRHALKCGRVFIRAERYRVRNRLARGALARTLQWGIQALPHVLE